MSSPPEPRTFEGWIEEDWPGATRRPDVMGVLEPYREAVQYALDDFDDETQSWRDQCGRIYGWGFGPNDEGAVPHAVQKKVSEMMTREPEVEKAPAPPDLDAWRAEAGACAPLAAAASPAPWFFDSYSSVHSEPLTREHSRIEATIPDDAADDDPAWATLPETLVCRVPCVAGDTGTAQGRADGAFIAAARDGWPRDAARLLDAAYIIDSLRADLRNISERYAHAKRILAADDPHETRGEDSLACPWECGTTVTDLWDWNWWGRDCIKTECDSCGRPIEVTAIKVDGGKAWRYVGQRGEPAK